MKYPKKRNSVHSRPTLTEIISRYCDIPPDLFGEVSLEMRGRNEMFFCGCREILEYSESEIKIETANDIVKITGRRLTMSSFCERRIEIKGEIDTICFCGGGDNAK